ncbi:tRNA 2-thiouridine(34) synthase MnmA [Candidatus Margulisiibacteriota bacterium]
MSTKTKVLCAMSGGVDSSVSAALLKEQGHQVVGITMQIFGRKNSIEDAKKVCSILDIPHHTLNLRKEFQDLVIKDFINEYKNGRTPNPCIRCNQFLKFDLLLKKAEQLGCTHIATGHYARIKSGRIFKGIDCKKDQSYVLYMLSQTTLSKTLFPLGEYTKEEVRKLAKQHGLPTAEKKESQELCFVEDDNYGRFISEKLLQAAKPGKLLDKDGNIVGEHNGIIHYTIGQKKGIGAHKVRKFVTNIDVKNNTVTIGDDSDLMQKCLTADNLSFTTNHHPAGKLEVQAKIRYNSREEPAFLEVINGKAKVTFNEKQRAITPGQSVVFYFGDEMIGGGIIR